MKFEKLVFAGIFSLISINSLSAQTAVPTPAPVAAPPAANSPVPTAVSRQQREQALAKLLEGQRYFWKLRQMRSQAGIAGNAKLARQAFLKSVELDPSLAESYTALAELSISSPPGNLEEAVGFARSAVKIDPDNFGAHRILARLYTFNSGLKDGKLDRTFAPQAVAEWKKISELDARNAEAWAFLSAFYDLTGESEKRIAALRSWIGSAAPLETQFYSRVMGADDTLTTENATIKLAVTLKNQGSTREAVELLSQVIADSPENADAISQLSQVVEASDGAAAGAAVEALRQAVYANPANPALTVLLARVQARAGKIEDGAKTLRDAAAKLAGSDKASAAGLQVALGDLLAENKRTDESAKAYRDALQSRGIENAPPATDDDREFALGVFDKMIRLYKNAARPNDVKSVIEQARKVLGDADLFADRQMISYYRETGKKPEALAEIRRVRARYPEDYNFLTLEATLLAETGKVDEAVRLIKGYNVNKKLKIVSEAGKTDADSAGQPSFGATESDDFSMNLMISGLYTQAGRGKEAVEAANEAFKLARGEERKQIAKLTLATAQQMSGDFTSAETTLREILRQMPGNPIALNNLGYFLLERDEKFPEALRLIQRAIEIDPTNPSYLDSLGWAHYKLGNYAEAEKNLKQALMYDAESAAIHEHLGDVYLKQNKLADANSSWRRALSLSNEEKESARLKAKIK